MTFLWCCKVEEETLNIRDGHTKILVCTTCGLNIFKNPPEAVKVATLVKFFNVEKTKACYHHQDFLFEYFFVKKYDNDYLRVSFTAIVIVLLFDREIFGPKILMLETTISFFVWRFGCLEAEQKPV